MTYIPGILHFVVLFSAYAAIWFLVLFCLLPVGLGAVDPKTGAPLTPRFKQKVIWTTVIAALLWLVFYAFVGFGWLEV